MMKNHMIDVTFTVEGPWDEMEDIPAEHLLLGMQERLSYLMKANLLKTKDITEAFGWCDSYDV
jgi:hypothetical protein